MKGDFTRNTFDPKKHYRDVLIQQGRVQIDADWNEQAAVTARRDETTTADIVGDCGGPADNAAFGIVTKTSGTTAVFAGGQQSNITKAQQPQRPAPPSLPPGDFFLSAGRYYVDGIQCENEKSVRYRDQPDRLDVAALTPGAIYLLYLEVWQRHITALEDGQIREPALGGPDTGTRVKTIWQVRALKIGAVGDAGVIDPETPCGSGANLFNALADPGTAKLTAGTAAQPVSKDPCLVPPGAGYTGLENQLYRVEIHDPSTWKWSRENGSVVTSILKIDSTKITVSSLGPDKNLGFVKDAWVEILDDALELESKPGQLAQIDDVDEATHIVTLKTAALSLVPAGFSLAQFPNGIVPKRHPKLRRWEGVAPIQTGKWLALESGIQVNFAANGDYRTGHFWQIPARAATAKSPNGEIEWPGDDAGNRFALPAFGIKHHFCRLGIVTVLADGSINATDCRCLYSPLAHPELRSLGGDGQEIMPDLTHSNQLVPLPQPISVYVRNLQCTGAKLKLRFEVTPPSDKLILLSAPTNVSNAQGVLDIPAAVGIVRCEWRLDPQVQPLEPRKVEVSLVDASSQTLAPPLFFTANLSIASQVAYDPGKNCAALQDKTTVQDAIAQLASLTRLEAVGGDGQDAEPGAALANPIRVLVTSSCGPVADAHVQFDIATNKGRVADFPSGANSGSSLQVKTGGDGIAACLWTPDPEPAHATQELTATLILDKTVLSQPAMLRFTANLRLGHGACCVTVGQGGEFANLSSAFSELKKKNPPEICICLLPGDHIVSELAIPSALSTTGGTAFDAASLGNVGTTAKASGAAIGRPAPIALRHLHIHGCGRASRILLKQSFQVIGLDSIVLQDLCIHSVLPQLRPIVIDGCNDVTITGCELLKKESVRTDLVTIKATSRIHIADNIISSITPQITTGVSDVADTTSGSSISMGTLVDATAANLASKSKSERAAFVKEFRTIVRDTPKGDPKKKVLEAALKRITKTRRVAKKASVPAPVDASLTQLIDTPSSLAATIVESALPLPQVITQPATVIIPPPPPPRPTSPPPPAALVIADANADTAIINNIITGEVRIYGTTGHALSRTVFDDLAKEIKEQRYILSAPSMHSLRIEGNSLTRVIVDSQIVLPNAPDQKGTPTLVVFFVRMSLLDNTFHAAGQQWLAVHVISNGNHFIQPKAAPSAPTPNGDNLLYLGTAAGASFICVGTSCNFLAELGYELFSGASGAGQPFNESANLIRLRQLP